MLVRRLTSASVVLLLGAALGSACSSSPKNPGYLSQGGSPGTGGTYSHKEAGGGQGGADAGDASSEAEAGGSGGTSGTAGNGGMSGTTGTGGDAGLPAHCSDNKKDQGETDVDCGGPCAPCGTGKVCAVNADCQSQVCDSTNKTCNAPSCSDNVKNGSETDVDCGGKGGCNPCFAGKSCLLPTDCMSGVCSGTPLKCQAPTCNDGVKNGNETDKDCGGSCQPCGRGAVCQFDSDCVTNVCDTSHHCACPSGMITVPLPGGGGGSFCIDQYEVSYADYTAFYNSNPPAQIGACAWKTNYTPTANWPSNDVNLPVRDVDWCDAYGYCQAQHKRLCGQIGGGAGSYTNYTDAYESQWFDACSAQGANTYPYSGAFAPGKCNGAPTGDAGSGTLLDTNRSPNSCQGGEFFLYDMSGNVAEWTDECQGPSATPKTDNCRVRGGSDLDGSANLTCAAPRTLQRSAVADDVGFRCCLD